MSSLRTSARNSGSVVCRARSILATIDGNRPGRPSERANHSPTAAIIATPAAAQKSPEAVAEAEKGYAATTVPERSNSDESYVVFHHASGSWSVLSSGTADICPGVPADVVQHFRSARYGACR